MHAHALVCVDMRVGIVTLSFLLSSLLNISFSHFQPFKVLPDYTLMGV